MNSGLINFHNNEPENLIDDPESFYSTAADSYVITRAPTYKQIPPGLAQLDGGSN